MSSRRRSNILIWGFAAFFGLLILITIILQISNRRKMFESEEQERKWKTCNKIWGEYYRLKEEERKANELKTLQGDSIANVFHMEAEELDSFYKQCMEEYEKGIYTFQKNR